MAGNYSVQGADLDKIYMPTTTLIDKFVKTGSLWMWGLNSYGGYLGDNTTIDRSSPVQTISGGTNWRQLSVGRDGAVTIKTDGTLWAWGNNTNGQLGDNTVIKKSSPIQTVAAGTNWKQASTGGYHTACIKTDGTLWIWGKNAQGQLGDNTVIRKSSPVQTIAGGTNWKQVATGKNITGTIKTDGTLWAWGEGGYGSLGDNIGVDKSSPVQTVAGGTNWNQVVCGAQHMLAVKTDGTLWGWGRNDIAMLGDNTIINRISPVQTVAGGTNWKQPSAGQFFSSCIKTDGTLWTWGYNNYGQLGDNTVIQRNSPVQTIAGGTNWKQAGSLNNENGGQPSMSCIKTDGTLWTWGGNTYGGLGDNTIIHRSSPIQTVAGGTNWKQCSGGGYLNGAIHFYDAYNLYPK